MENIKKKMAELCEAVAAKGGNVIIIGDVKDNELEATICQMHGKVHALSADMARVAQQKDGKPVCRILVGATLMLEFGMVTEKYTKVEVTK